MPLPTKTLSPAELAKLEHAFATDPASEAYKPLAEAYLGMGRFMEAMVVCKKGVKAHPSAPDARILLARVYADQGKDKKALEELAGAVAVAPNDKGVLRMMGALQIKTGELEPGKANLLKAFEADPSDGETITVLQANRIEVPKPAPVAAPPPVLQQAPVAVQPVQQQAAAQQPGAPRTSPPMAGQGAPRTSAPRAQQMAVRPITTDFDDEPNSQVSEVSDGRRGRKTSGTSKALFFLLLFIVPVSAAAYYGVGQYKARQAREVKRLLLEANDALKSDTYASYKKACEQAELALNQSPDSSLAHSYLAYAYTIRFGEHERSDEIKNRAQENLTEAKANKDGKEPISHFYAADALFKYYDGKGAQARTELEDLVKKFEADNKRPALLQLTLGIIQMNQGDLEAAKETLEKAQGNAPDDPRVFVALGNLNRRRGNDPQALTNFNSALKYTRNSHPDALMGTALLILDQDNPAMGYINAAKYLKTLLESDPPPSPRQLAMAHFIRAFLVSRVATDINQYTDKAFQKQLEEGTGVTGDINKARAEVQKEEDQGLTLDRLNPELFLVRGKRLASEQKYDEAVIEIRKAIDMNATMAQFHVELAKVQMKKEGGEKAAEESLRKALQLVPNSPKLLSMLGQALYKQKKIDEARDTLEKAVADPKSKNPESRYLLGRIYRDDKKDYDKAAALLEKAATEYYSDPSMAANAYDDLASTYDLKGDKDRARANFEKAINADKEFSPAFCHYARFMVKVNDPKDKDKIRGIAAESVKLDPKGECAAEMTKLSQ